MTRHLPLILIAGLTIAFRAMGNYLPGSQPNFQPLVAMFFCGALLAPGWRGFAIPMALWAATYPFGVGPIYDASVFATTLVALALTFGFGSLISRRSFPTLLAGSVGAAVIFHLVTNTAAWLGDPMYAKSFHGFWQSIWTGPVSSEIPSWVFLRNLAAANLLFTCVFASAQLRIPRSRKAATAVVPSPPVFAK
jgi:hypothetical protein